MVYESLNPKKALIWRMTHLQNIPWILDNGLHAANSDTCPSDWFTIGNEELINRRAYRQVPVDPKGVLNDCIPFYFTPFSPMMYNIHTGRGGVKRINNEDIVILVSGMHKVLEMDLSFVFTDRHAYPVTTNYYNNLKSLAAIDWELLQQRDFQRDPDDPEKVERYQAEALVYKHMPIKALLGAVCYRQDVSEELQKQAHSLGVKLDIRCRPTWYF